jgi:penicillin amidase
MEIVTRVLSTFLGALCRTLARPSLPVTSGAMTLRGLRTEAKVYRDRWGVAHIFAASEADAFRAQDSSRAGRLFQMDFSRRAGLGRLAEIVGPVDAPWEDLTIHLKGATMVDMDHYIRTLGLAGAAAESAKRYSPAMIAYLEAYAAGVNAYIDANRKRLPWSSACCATGPTPGP